MKQVYIDDDGKVKYLIMSIKEYKKEMLEEYNKREADIKRLKNALPT